MLDRYDGSYVLAAAAYNAGPGPGRANGSRASATRATPDVDPVIWIETIPFTETRNYVMRVLEGLHVYRARLQGRPAPLTLAADIGASCTRRSRDGSCVKVSVSAKGAASVAGASAD